MEITALGLIAILLVLFIFRKPVRKVSSFVDSELTTVILESQVENTIAANEAMAELQAELGNDFQSVEDCYRRLTQRKRQTKQQAQA